MEVLEKITFYSINAELFWNFFFFPFQLALSLNYVLLIYITAQQPE